MPSTPSSQNPAAKANHEREHERHADRAQLPDELPAWSATSAPSAQCNGSRSGSRFPVSRRYTAVRLPDAPHGGRDGSCHDAGRLFAGGAAALLFSAALLAQANERVLYVSAWDAKTRAPITGLGVDAFAVREDGARREVLRVTPATSPMPVAILVDNSQAARDHIADIRKALTAFVKTHERRRPDRDRRRRRSPDDPARLHHRSEAARRRGQQGLRDARLRRHAARRDRRDQPGPAEARGGSRRARGPHDRKHRVQRPALQRGARRH